MFNKLVAFWKGLNNFKSNLIIASVIVSIVTVSVIWIRHDARQDYIKKEEKALMELIIERNKENEQNQDSIGALTSDILRSGLLRKGEGILPDRMDGSEVLSSSGTSYGQIGSRESQPEQFKPKDSLKPLCQPDEIEVYYDFDVGCEKLEDE